MTICRYIDRHSYCLESVPFGISSATGKCMRARENCNSLNAPFARVQLCTRRGSLPTRLVEPPPVSLTSGRRK